MTWRWITAKYANCCLTVIMTLVDMRSPHKPLQRETSGWFRRTTRPVSLSPPTQQASPLDLQHLRQGRIPICRRLGVKSKMGNKTTILKAIKHLVVVTKRQQEPYSDHEALQVPTTVAYAGRLRVACRNCKSPIAADFMFVSRVAPSKTRLFRDFTALVLGCSKSHGWHAFSKKERRNVSLRCMVPELPAATT